MLHLIKKCKTLAEQTFASFFGHQSYQRYVVLGHARTGSNYLLDGLKTSKYVKVHHEIFAGNNREIGKDFELIISRLYQKVRKRYKVVVFKLFYYHLTEDEWKKFLSYDDIRVIHLTRENRLKTIISLDIAFKTDQWSNTSIVDQPAEKCIRLDPANIVTRIENIHRQEELARTRFKGRPVLEVVYERLTAKPDEVFEQVGDFLGVNDIDTSKIGLLKQNPESLRTLIINYDEIARVLTNTRFCNYIDS